MSNEALDQAAAAVATAPRIALKDIEALIVSESYNVFGGRLTICVATLKNGFLVTGESSAASPENFNSELGRTAARQRVVEKIWMLEGYALRERLHHSETHPDVASIAGRLLADPDTPDEIQRVCASALRQVLP